MKISRSFYLECMADKAVQIFLVNTINYFDVSIYAHPPMPIGATSF